MLRTTDNNCGNFIIDCQHSTNLQLIANKKISSLISEENSKLLVFPHDLDQYGDKISEEYIFSLNASSLITGNIMGFIGINDSELTIQSRFAKNGQDYFLHYMLQRIFSINLFDLKHSTDQTTIFDFLLYIFPFYLKKALKQGLYKEYQKRDYNDSNVHGSIDINSHIKKNRPFLGRVAYRVREHSYDNWISQLIRHTIEHIRHHKMSQGVLNIDAETQNCVMQIIQATPSYDYRDRNTVINKNLRPFHHPYFLEYRNLQKVCLQILRYEGLKYGNEKDKIYGLLFDGAWLWEEYLNTLLKDSGFHHPKNKSSEGAIYLFDKSKCKRFPDFWKENFILDAKYKRLAGKDAEKIDRNDMNQIISYMYVKQAKLGGFITPSDDDKSKAEMYSLGFLNGYGGEVKIWSLSVPKEGAGYSEFCNQMKQSEMQLLNLLEERNLY